MHAYAVIEMAEGKPAVDFAATPVSGYVLAAGPVGGFGLYLVSGTTAQLAALNALTNVWGLVAMGTSGGVHWGQLDTTISTAIRTKLNTWLTAGGYPAIPTGWTYRQVLAALVQHMKRANDDWDLNITWVKDT